MKHEKNPVMDVTVLSSVSSAGEVPVTAGGRDQLLPARTVSSEDAQSRLAFQLGPGRLLPPRTHRLRADPRCDRVRRRGFRG